MHSFLHVETFCPIYILRKPHTSMNLGAFGKNGVVCYSVRSINHGFERDQNEVDRRHVIDR